MPRDPFAEATIHTAGPMLHEGRLVFHERYCLIRRLGQGGMGEVWLARDEFIGGMRALKFAPPEVAGDARSVVTLKKEVQAGMRLTHENIVRIHDFAHEPAERLSAVIMEYIEGQTLANMQAERLEVTNDGFFEPEEIEGWLPQICAALDYAHQQKIIHRDLKPHNLMIETATGRLKILDFGVSHCLAESFSQLTGRGASGTLPYMSPQQLMDEDPAPADDIYSLGATLYDLLTGSPPFSGGSIETQIREKAPQPIVARRSRGNATSGRRVPEAWEKLIMHCLAKERASRPAGWNVILQVLTSGLGLPEGRFPGDSLRLLLREDVPVDFCWCPAGTFIMGSPPEEEGRDQSEDQVPVSITQGFWMAKYPVTQLQWSAVTGENPSHFRGDDLPVESVSWEDAREFLRRAQLTLKGRPVTGWYLSLPTEAQWEYACRAGTTTPFNFGTVCTGRHANCSSGYPQHHESSDFFRGLISFFRKTSSVHEYAPNAWGLCDMHGNVWEWCADWYNRKCTGGDDPAGVKAGTERACRGGAWQNGATRCRSASRARAHPGKRSSLTGFRLILVPSRPTQSNPGSGPPDPLRSQ